MVLLLLAALGAMAVADTVAAEAGTVHALGTVSYGHLGDGTTIYHPLPVQVIDSLDPSMVLRFHSIAVLGVPV